MGKWIEAAKVLLEEMASNNYHWASERPTPYRSSGKYAIDVVTLLASRLDALAQRLDRVGTSLTPGGSSGSSIGVYAISRPVACRGTHQLSATMAHPPLSTLMLSGFSTPTTAYFATYCLQPRVKELLKPLLYKPQPTSSKCHATTRVPV